MTFERYNLGAFTSCENDMPPFISINVVDEAGNVEIHVRSEKRFVPEKGYHTYGSEACIRLSPVEFETLCNDMAKALKAAA